MVGPIPPEIHDLIDRLGQVPEAREVLTRWAEDLVA